MLQRRPLSHAAILQAVLGGRLARLEVFLKLHQHLQRLLGGEGGRLGGGDYWEEFGVPGSHGAEESFTLQKAVIPVMVRT